MSGNTESKSQRGSFPVKLYELVEGESAKSEEEIIVTWCEGGLAFIVRDMTRFCEEVLPQHFCHNKWASFIRQLNLYGFRRITQGQSSGAYWHKYFQRGQPQLLRGISRSRRGASQSAFGATAEDHDDAFRRLPGPTLGNAQPSVNPAWRQHVSTAPPLQSLSSLPPPPIISDEALLRELDTLVQQQKVAQEKLASPSPASSAGSLGGQAIPRRGSGPHSGLQRPAVVVVPPQQPKGMTTLGTNESPALRTHVRRGSDGIGTDDATVVAIKSETIPEYYGSLKQHQIQQNSDPTPVSAITQIRPPPTNQSQIRSDYIAKQSSQVVGNGTHYPIAPLVSTKELSPSFEKLVGLSTDVTKQQHESAAMLSHRKRIASHQSVHSVGSHDNMTEIGGHPLQKRENTTRRTTSKLSLASDDWDLNIADVDSLNLDEWRWNDTQNNDIRLGNLTRQDSRNGTTIYNADRIYGSDLPRSDSLRFSAFSNNRSFTSPTSFNSVEGASESAPVI